MKETQDILKWLEESRNSKNVEGMSRFGINTDKAFGVPMPALRTKAREYKKNHTLAAELWSTGIHECRLMAPLIADPQLTTPLLIQTWVEEFDSWDVCDQCCINLIRHMPFAHSKIWEYAPDEREFVRRTAFVLIATLAVHDKKADDNDFLRYLGLITEYSGDNRNFVKKAVNWALRQIGKRNFALNEAAAKTAGELASSDLSSARWIGKDAFRELTSQKTLDYIRDHRK